jgi:hypothetical protein
MDMAGGSSYRLMNYIRLATSHGLMSRFRNEVVYVPAQLGGVSVGQLHMLNPNAEMLTVCTYIVTSMQM